MKFSRRKIMSIIIVILLIIGATSFAYTFLLAPKVEEFDMYLTIGDNIGFNADTDAIYFGIIPPGGSGSRKIILENDAYFSKKVKISTSGELADWIWLKENNFILNESKEIEIHILSPEDAVYGDYTGKLRITFRKVYISPQLF